MNSVQDRRPTCHPLAYPQIPFVAKVASQEYWRRSWETMTRRLARVFWLTEEVCWLYIPYGWVHEHGGLNAWTVVPLDL